jgi:hypothetical protein
MKEQKLLLACSHIKPHSISRINSESPNFPFRNVFGVVLWYRGASTPVDDLTPKKKVKTNHDPSFPSWTPEPLSTLKYVLPN